MGGDGTANRLNTSTNFIQQRLQRPSPQINGVWVDGLLTTNPSANDVLADTGALDAGDYVFAFIFTSTGAGSLQIQYRDSTNSSNQAAHTFPISANGVLEPVIPTKITLSANERIRVIASAGITGDVEVSILYAKLVG